MDKTYYTSQVPVEAIEFTVVDELRKARSLVAYTGAEVYFTSPDGASIEGGSADITDAANGKVTYDFPAVTIFATKGQYRVQLKLTNGTREDYADVTTIRVIDRLEGGIS